MRKIILILTLLLTQSCSALESDYDKLMNPIKKIKLAEEKAGKPSLAFDGAVEPKFPDEEENNKTLEGVDSNHDGVRDDIEIWINRTAEDEYVRASLKESYRKQIDFFNSLYHNEPEAKVHPRLSTYSAVDGCVAILTAAYDKTYLSKYKKDATTFYTNVLVNIFFSNTSLRAEQISKWNGFNFNGTIGGDSDVECIKYSFGKRYIEILESYKKNNSRKN
ncbi:MAG: hypothetical protein H7336_16405 [Bacteriovorax sp.]|nr:hypothetical protein [Bacteriovorax sp.]